MNDIEEKPEIAEEKNSRSIEEEMKEYKDKYLRLLAEIDNTRKRMQKERQEMTRFAVENVLGELLAPIDNMENALKFTDNMSDEVRNWAQGFRMILDQFKEALNNHGVTAFHSEGNVFDPNWHHAIETEETTSVPEGTIIQEFVKGYKSGDRTLRAARVKVAVVPGKKHLNQSGSEELPPDSTTSEQ